METRKLKPRAGLTIRDEHTLKPLDAAGETKPLTVYWRRRLRCGDVEVAEEVAPPPPPKKRKDPTETIKAAAAVKKD